MPNPHIKKVKIFNYRRFVSFEIPLDPKKNVLIGDNEAGKSSILSAVDIVLSGSRHKVESVGLDSLFNKASVETFLALTEKNYEDLPVMKIELYLTDQGRSEWNGKFNSDDVESDGLILICEPSDVYGDEIKEILRQPQIEFPFESVSYTHLTLPTKA